LKPIMEDKQAEEVQKCEIELSDTLRLKGEKEKMLLELTESNATIKKEPVDLGKLQRLNVMKETFKTLVEMGFPRAKILSTLQKNPNFINTDGSIKVDQILESLWS